MSIKVLTLLVVTITAIGVFLGPYLAELVRRKHRKREEHFMQIKEKIFKPLLTRLEIYYLPIIERKETNVKTVAVPTRERPSTIGKEHRLFSSKLEITVGEKDIDNILYEDAKENHFEGLFRRLEDFEERFMKYSKKCLEIINNLKEKVVNNIKLKDYTGNEESYMFPGALAIFLFERRFLLGRENNYLRIQSNGSKKVLKDWNRNYARGDNGEIKECYDYIEKLFKEGLDVENFLEILKGLKKEAIEIRDKIREIILSQDLPGNCKLIQ